MVYLPWLLLPLLAPYWLGPIVVWLTQKVGVRPVFEPFTPGRHSVPADAAAAFRQTCDALSPEGFHVVADLFQTGQMRHVSTRGALLENSRTGELTEQVDAGRWRRDDRADVFRPKFTSAWVMTWQLLPPFSMLRRWRIRRRAAAILQELNMAGPDPRPIAQPRTRVSLRWVAVAVILVLLLNQLGSRLLRTTWSVPSDFVAPAAFPDAVRALERLAGGAATPLVGTDSVGDSLRTEGFQVSVPPAQAERLVPARQAPFLQQRFYLFRSNQPFGIRGPGDRRALVPRSDRYEILRLIGTNGWNYGIGPDSIIAWHTAPERDHPFVLTGMGFDWVEGRF